MSNKSEKFSAEKTGLQGRSFDCLEDEVDALLETIDGNLNHVDEIMKDDFLSTMAEVPAVRPKTEATPEGKSEEKAEAPPAAASAEAAKVEDELAGSNDQEIEMDEVKTPSVPAESADGEAPAGANDDFVSSEDEASSSSSQEDPDMIVEETSPIDQAIESAVDQMLQADDNGHDNGHDNDNSSPATSRNADGLVPEYEDEEVVNEAPVQTAETVEEISEPVTSEVAAGVSVSEPAEPPADAELRTDPQSVEPESTAEADDPDSIDVPIDQMLTEAVAAAGIGQTFEETDRIATPTAESEVDQPTSTEETKPAVPTPTIPTPVDEPTDEPTESKDAGAEEPGTETMSEDDLEDLDRMLADAAGRVLSEGDGEVGISSSAAMDETTPKIEEPAVDAIERAVRYDGRTAPVGEAVESDVDGQESSTSQDESEPIPADSTAIPEAETVPASQSATEAPVIIDHDSDSVEADEALSPLSTGGFGALILEYSARFGEKLPAPVAEISNRLRTKIAAIPFRKKLTEWGMAALARANRPWSRFPKDLQIGLLIITTFSFTLGVVAILIAWMRGG